MNHGDIHGKGQPIVHFQKESLRTSLSNGISMRAHRVLRLHYDATGRGIIVVIFEELFYPVVHVWVEIFGVGGDIDAILVGLIWCEILFRVKVFLVTGSQI